MSDNPRPMLYDAVYDVRVADRFDAAGEPATVVGKHCESGDVLVRRTRLPDPRPGDVLVTPVTGAYGHAMASNYNGIRRPPVVFCARRRGARRRPPRDLRGPECPRRLRSACSATGRSAPRSRRCSRERADAIVPVTGLRPELSGVLTRSRGDFDEILAGSDLIVELMGGVEPARDYVLRAMRAGKHVVSANKQLLSQHGEELWACAREHGVQLRFEAAVAGVVPVIRVLQESLAAAHVERIHGIVNGTTNYILTEMARGGLSYADALAPGAGSSATRRPTRPTTSPAATPRRRWRSSPGWPSTRRCTSTRSATRASSTSRADDIAYAQQLGLGLKLIGTAERVDGGLSVRVHPAFLYGGHPLASVNGPFNAVTVESAGDHRDHDVGPGRGRPADGVGACSAT